MKVVKVEDIRNTEIFDQNQLQPRLLRSVVAMGPAAGLGPSNSLYKSANNAYPESTLDLDAETNYMA